MSTPQPSKIHYIRPDMESFYNEPLTVQQKDYEGSSEDGNYWMDFEVAPRWIALDRLLVRTRGCLANLSINDQPVPLKEGDWKLLCDNNKGIRLKNMAGILSKKSTWNIDGSTPSSSYGITLEKDWSDPKLIFALSLLVLALMTALYLKLPLPQYDARLFVVALLGLGFVIRFWMTFIEHPPELAIWSDMGGYIERAMQISRGDYRESQLFQPVGFTLWSMWLRNLGGFEFFNWGQVFLSWGSTVFVVLISLKYFTQRVSIVVVLLSVFHLGWIGMAEFHLSETLYTFLMMAGLYWGLRAIEGSRLRDFLILGVLTMAAFYVKGTHSFFVPLFSAWWLFKNRRQFNKAFVQLSVMAIGCLIVATPHLVWTAKKYGKAHFGPTAGALNFVEGKCPSKNNADSSGSSWMSPLFTVIGETTKKKWDRPFTDQKYFWKEGLKCIQADPWVMVSSVRYVYYLFYDNPAWPLGTLSNAKSIDLWTKLYSYLFIPVSLLGFLVLLRLRNSVAWLGGLYIAALFLTVYIFKSELRFRLPFDGIFILWGSYGVFWLYEKLRVESRSSGAVLVFNHLPAHVAERTPQFHSVQARVDEDLDL